MRLSVAASMISVDVADAVLGVADGLKTTTEVAWMSNGFVKQNRFEIGKLQTENNIFTFAFRKTRMCAVPTQMA